MSTPQIFILDASVAAKWYLREKLTEKALPFMERLSRQEIRIVVPEIFYSELASTCWKSVKRRGVPIGCAIAYLDCVMDLPLETYSDRELSDVALENALRFNISVYDALYLSLAEVYLAPFVTADEALVKACKRFDFIEFLGDV